jgi:hypothetical protein
MKKEYKLLLIIAGSMLVLSVIVALSLSLFVGAKNTPENKIFGSSVTLDNEKVVSKLPAKEDAKYNLLTYSYTVSKKGEVIGVLYVGRAQNSYGSLDVYIGINYNGKPNNASQMRNHTYSVEVVGLDQTPAYYKTIQEYVQKYLVGNKVSDYKNLPLQISAGATTAHVSIETIAGLVNKAIVKHYNIIEDPYVDYYGENYVKGDEVVLNDSISKQVITGTTNGYVLIVSGVINTREDSEPQTVKLEFLFDSTDKLLGLLYVSYASDDFSKTHLNQFIASNLGKTRSELGNAFTNTVFTGNTIGISKPGLNTIIQKVSEVEL